MNKWWSHLQQSRETHINLILQVRKLKCRKTSQAAMWTKDARWEGLEARRPMKGYCWHARKKLAKGFLLFGMRHKLPDQREMKVGEQVGGWVGGWVDLWVMGGWIHGWVGSGGGNEQILRGPWCFCMRHFIHRIKIFTNSNQNGYQNIVQRMRAESVWDSGSMTILSNVSSYQFCPRLMGSIILSLTFARQIRHKSALTCQAFNWCPNSERWGFKWFYT